MSGVEIALNRWERSHSCVKLRLEQTRYKYILTLAMRMVQEKIRGFQKAMEFNNEGECDVR